MKKILLSIMLLSLLSSVAMASLRSEYIQKQRLKTKNYQLQQNQEAQEFKASLKESPKEERKSAAIKQQEIQQQKKIQFADQRYQDNRLNLEAKLASNKKLTQEQKAEIMKNYDEGYQNQKGDREDQYKVNTEFFAKLASDETMSEAQRKDAIKVHLSELKKKNMKQREEVKEKKSIEIKRIRSINEG